MDHFEMDDRLTVKANRISPLLVKRSIRVAVTVAYSVMMIQKGWAAESTDTDKKVDYDPMSVEYNSGFIHGSSVDLSRYMTGNPIAPGTYSVYVIVNGENRGRYDIDFASKDNKANATPYVTLQELQAFGIRLDNPGLDKPQKTTKNSVEQRYFIPDLINDAKVYYNQGDFELNVDVPQVNLVKHPRGYVDPRRWESGVTAGYLDYNANIYASSSDAKREDYSGNLGLLLGFNIGDWRFRKRLNTSWSHRDGTHTENLYGYAETDVTPLKARLTVGDSNTTGELFDSFNLRGVQLTSDDRMLPEGLRNYTPMLRGVAETNAQVIVTQRGQKVYETVVPPGEFELNDIGAMGYGGDLQMTIIESDGRRRIQNIPFSAPPLLLHKGVSRFSASVGKLNDKSIQGTPKILQGVYQYGLGNNYTIYGGGQLSEHYGSFAIGNSINTPIGGFSLDITRAYSDLKNGEKSSGNSISAGYTKYLTQSGTNMTLAAYRYSSKGYYSFQDASLTRYGNGNSYIGAGYRAKERFTVSLSQDLWTSASLNLSASLYNYWDDKKSAREYSVTFNKSQRYFNYSVTASRTNNGDGKYNNAVMFSVNIPIGSSGRDKPLFSSLYSTASHDSNGHNTFQMNANGSKGEQSELNYGIGTAISGDRGSNSQEAVLGNVNYRSSVGQFGMTASINNTSSRQVSGSASGSVVAHRGGVTLGSQIGESAFAIIGAKGADGAKVINGYGTSVGRSGYAIMPSLTPYRENYVSIDTKGLPDTVDVMENEKVVVPRNGAAISVDMKTIVGKPIILIVRDGNDYLPIGTELVDDKGNSQSIIGQGGMAFIRGWDPATKSLYAVLSNGKGKCRIVPDQTRSQRSGATSGSIEQREMTCTR